MKGLLLINLVFALIMLGISWQRSTGSEFYPSTIPTMVQAGLAVLLALAGLVLPRFRFSLLVVSGLALGLLGLPAFYAGSCWPGGDDGGGLGWLVIVGGGCAVSFVVALATSLLGLMQHQKNNSFPAIPTPIPATQNAPSPAAGTSQKITVLQQHKAGRWWLWTIVILGGLYLGWIIIGPISWKSTRLETHPGGIEIQSIDYHEVTPLFPIPLYHHVNANHERILRVNGREVMRSNNFKNLFPSPQGTYVVAEDWLRTQPIRIYAMVNSRYLELASDSSEKEFPGHYNSYPFHFLHWEDDTYFLAEVTGTDWSSASPLRDYRQVWRVAADTGERIQIQ